jgi:hypothetical protein
MKKVINALLKQMIKADHHGWFYEPVTDEVAAGYSAVVSKPMCFMVMREKSERWAYPYFDLFVNDFNLVFDNCYKFNQESSPVVAEARKIQEAGLALIEHGRAQVDPEKIAVPEDYQDDPEITLIITEIIKNFKPTIAPEVKAPAEEAQTEAMAPSENVEEAESKMEVVDVEPPPPPPPEPTYSYIGVLGHFEKDLAVVFENRIKNANIPNPFEHLTRILETEYAIPDAVVNNVAHGGVTASSASDSATPAPSSNIASSILQLASIRNAFVHTPIHLVAHQVTPEQYDASVNRFVEPMSAEVKSKVTRSLAVVKHHQLSFPVREDIKSIEFSKDEVIKAPLGLNQSEVKALASLNFDDLDLPFMKDLLKIENEYQSKLKKFEEAQKKMREELEAHRKEEDQLFDEWMSNL